MRPRPCCRVEGATAWQARNGWIKRPPVGNRQGPAQARGPSYPRKGHRRATGRAGQQELPGRHRASVARVAETVNGWNWVALTLTRAQTVLATRAPGPQSAFRLTIALKYRAHPRHGVGYRSGPGHCFELPAMM